MYNALVNQGDLIEELWAMNNAIILYDFEKMLTTQLHVHCILK